MFNNPMYYNNFYPYQNTFGKGSFLKNSIGFFNKNHINWSNILNNTQKTLNVINQAIPVYYQIKPIYQNAKTMFKMVNILKNDNSDNHTNSDNLNTDEKNTNFQGPVFFI